MGCGSGGRVPDLGLVPSVSQVWWPLGRRGMRITKKLRAILCYTSWVEASLGYMRPCLKKGKGLKKTSYDCLFVLFCFSFWRQDPTLSQFETHNTAQGHSSRKPWLGSHWEPLMPSLGPYFHAGSQVFQSHGCSPLSSL